MDSGDGRMIPYETYDELDELKRKYPKSKGCFTVGEEIEIKSSRFKVKKITPFGITLKVLKSQ